MIKATIDGTVLDRRAVIHARDIGKGTAKVATVISRRAALERPVHAEVPFADAGSVVALLFQQPSEGETIFGNEGSREPAEHPALQMRAPVVAPCEQAVARGRADTGGGVRICEPHAFLG